MIERSPTSHYAADDQLLQSRKFTFSDLTLKEVKKILGAYFTATIACLVIYGGTYLILVGLDSGAKSALPEEQYSWLAKAAGLLLAAFVVYIIVKDLSYMLRILGVFLISLGRTAAKATPIKKIAGICLAGSYLYFQTHFPNAGLWFLVLVLIPVSYAYSTYSHILNSKTSIKLQTDDAFGK